MMKAGNIHSVLLILLIALAGSSCSVTRNLEEDEQLYTGTKVEMEDMTFTEEVGLEGELKEVAVPEPNDRILGLIPVRLMIYNMVDDTVTEDGSGFNRWLKYEIGRKPVLFKPIHIEQSKIEIRNSMFSKGYFEADVSSEKQSKSQKVSVTYKVTAGPQYMIEELTFDSTLNKLDYPLSVLKEKTLLDEDEPYDLELMRNERERIAKKLQDRGYYYFIENYIIFKVDSNRRDKNLKLYVGLKENIPDKAFRRYNINEIVIYPDYSIRENDDTTDSTKVGGAVIIDSKKRVNHDLIRTSVRFKRGDLYTADAYTNTLNKLMGLGIFKYANITFKEDTLAPDSIAPALNMKVYLTQMIPVSTRVELRAVTKSNDYSGPFLYLTYLNRNTFGGAEELNLNLDGGFESQWTRSENPYISYEVGFNASITFPKFITPFIDMNKYLAERYTPNTTFRLGYSLENRVRYFTSNTFEGSYGFQWQETENKSHNWRLIHVSYSSITNKTGRFEELLNENPLLRQSFEERFILSQKYTYKLEMGNGDNTRNKWSSFLNVSGELAGNVLTGIEYLFEDFEKDKMDGEFLGLDYSRFFRVTPEYRIIYDFNKEVKLVNRYLLGAGFPLGLSRSLPYSRQYFIGGPNSLRGFHFRTIGPGSYEGSQEDQYIFTHNGNVKILGNLELRFPIVGVLKGAVFVDAGNIWTWEESTEKPGGKISWDDLGDEMAFNTGFGLRVDISFFILRLDLGIPLRLPYEVEGKNWISPEPLKAAWRTEYPVLNIALGYPF